MEQLMDDAFAEILSLYRKVQNQEVRRLSRPFVRRKLLPMIRELCGNADMYRLIRELNDKDAYTFRHCIGVALVSYWIGSWSGMEKKQLQDLAISGFLHDIGKLQTADDILKKPGKLSAIEYSEIKQHTVQGYEMLRIFPQFKKHAMVALQHHERENGSGYPYGHDGSRIDSSAKIVAVADVFHTMITARVYKRPLPLYQALAEIYQHAVVLFEADIVRCFIANMMNGTIGGRVRLTNGQTARIVMLHEDDLIRPLIKIGAKLHDLRHSGFQIVDFIGENADAII